MNSNADTVLSKHSTANAKGGFGKPADTSDTSHLNRNFHRNLQPCDFPLLQKSEILRHSDVVSRLAAAVSAFRCSA